jgi:biotin transport system substrate-specific component
MISARSAGLRRSLAIRLALTVAGSLILAASAQIAVPMLPVPITLQTLAIPLLVLALGRDLGTLAVFLYLIEGATGIPVFALHTGGPAVLVGPTAGYLWCYPIAAYVIGVLVESALGVTYVGRWLAIFAGTSIVFVGGVWWLMAMAELSFAHAVAVGVAPFVIGDLLKTTVAAGLSRSTGRALLARLGT